MGVFGPSRPCAGTSTSLDSAPFLRKAPRSPGGQKGCRWRTGQSHPRGGARKRPGTEGLSREGHFDAVGAGVGGQELRSHTEVGTASVSQGASLRAWALREREGGAFQARACVLGENLPAPFLRVRTHVLVLTLLSPLLLHKLLLVPEPWKGLESTRPVPRGPVRRRPRPKEPEPLTSVTARQGQDPGVGSRPLTILSPQGTSRVVTRSPSQRTSRRTSSAPS